MAQQNAHEWSQDPEKGRGQGAEMFCLDVQVSFLFVRDSAKPASP